MAIELAPSKTPLRTGWVCTCSSGPKQLGCYVSIFQLLHNFVARRACAAFWTWFLDVVCGVAQEQSVASTLIFLADVAEGPQHSSIGGGFPHHRRSTAAVHHRPRCCSAGACPTPLEAVLAAALRCAVACVPQIACVWNAARLLVVLMTLLHPCGGIAIRTFAFGREPVEPSAPGVMQEAPEATPSPTVAAKGRALWL
jgi:hypothetical protein